MTRSPFFIALSAAAACTSPYGVRSADAAAPAVRSAYCWQPAAYKENLLVVVRSAITASGAAADESRSVLGLLADVGDSVYVVTNDELCRRASRARELLKAAPDTTNLSPILVLKAGRLRYVIDDGRTRAGEWHAALVTDTSFTVVDGLVH